LIGDQDVDVLASKGAEYGGILAFSSSNSHRSGDMTERIQVDSNHPISGRIPDFPPIFIIESQTDIPHCASTPNFFKLFIENTFPLLATKEEGSIDPMPTSAIVSLLKRLTVC
jgi:hypothetical protein